MGGSQVPVCYNSWVKESRDDSIKKYWVLNLPEIILYFSLNGKLSLKLPKKLWMKRKSFLSLHPTPTKLDWFISTYLNAKCSWTYQIFSSPLYKDIILTTNWAESPENKITNLKLNLFGTLLVLIYLKYFFISYPCVNSNCKGSTCKPSWCPHICWNK